MAGWIFCVIIYCLLFLVSMTFNIYVLIRLFAGVNSTNKDSRVGLSAIMALVMTLLVIQGLATFSSSAVLIYGACSGCLFGIHMSMRTYDKQLKDAINSGTGGIRARSTISISLWLLIASRFIVYIFVGAGVFYGLMLLLGFGIMRMYSL